MYQFNIVLCRHNDATFTFANYEIVENHQRIIIQEHILYTHDNLFERIS
jgi:hypothetical protein